METPLEKEVRFLKAYALKATLIAVVFVLTAFTLKGTQRFEKITAKQIQMVDSSGKVRVVLAESFHRRETILLA